MRRDETSEPRRLDSRARPPEPKANSRRRRPAEQTCTLLLITLLAFGCAAPPELVALDRGIRAQRSGERKLAAKAYRDALRRRPALRGANQNLALIAWGANKLALAEAMLRREISKHPAASDARIDLALLQAQRGQSGAAHQTASRLLRAPKIPRALRQIALVLAASTAPTPKVFATLKAPLIQLLKATAVDRHLRTSARRVLARAAYAARDWRGVSKALQGTIPSDLRPIRAAAAFMLGEYPALVQDAQQANAGPWTQLFGAFAAERTGDAKRARTIAVALVKRPDLLALLGAAADRLLASLAARRGDWSGALTALSRALTRPGMKLRPGLRLDHALALAHLGRITEAREQVDRVLTRHANLARARQLRTLLGR